MKINIKKTRHKPTYKRPNDCGARHQCISPCPSPDSKHVYRRSVDHCSHKPFHLYPPPNHVPGRGC